jgi:hypothetical protein
MKQTKNRQETRQAEDQANRQAQPRSRSRKSYASPRLTVHGRLEKITETQRIGSQTA